MDQSIRSLYNANVYLNGNSTFLQTEEITLPEPKPVEIDHKSLAMIGKVKLPTGFDAMEMKIKWNSFYPEVQTLMANIYQPILMQVRANSDIWVADALVRRAPVKAFITCRPKGVAPMGIKHQDNSEVENNFAVSSYRLEYDGVNIVHIDFNANIYMVGGVDMLAQYRQNLGLL